MTKNPFVNTDFLPRQPPFTPREAVALCRQRVKEHSSSCPHHSEVLNLCGHNAGCNYGFSTCGSTNAIGIWFATPAKYRRPGLEAMMNAPAGAVLIWKGGGSGAGHAGIKAEGPHIYGTDLPVSDQFGRFEIDQVAVRFSALEPVGWVFPLFPHAVSDGRKPPEVRPAEPKRKYPNLDDIVRLQQDTIAAAKRAAIRRERPADDRVLIGIVKSAREQIAAANSLRGGPKKAAAKKAAAKKTAAEKSASANSAAAPAKKIAKNAANRAAKKAPAKTAPGKKSAPGNA